MTKVMNKFLFFIFLGLLIFAAPLSFAAKEEQNLPADGYVHGVKYQDSHSFMNDNLIDGDKREFTRIYGETVNDINVVDCGTRKCNLKYNVCVTKKEDAGFWQELGNNLSNIGNTAGKMAVAGAATGAAAGSVVPGLGTAVGTAGGTIIGTAVGTAGAVVSDGWIDTVTTKYMCVPKGEEEDYRSKGWTVAEKGGITSHSSENSWGQSKGTTQEEMKDTNCFTAKKTSTESTDTTPTVTKYCLKIIGNRAEIVAANSKGRGNCPVIPVSLYNNSQCLFCPLLGVVLKVSDNITALSYLKLGPSFAIVMVLGMAIWIAMKTLAFVSSMTKQDAAKYITETLKQSYKFVIAYFALICYHDVFNFIILPLLHAGLSFSQYFMGADAFRFDSDTYNMLLAGSITEDVKKLLSTDYLRNIDNKFFSIGTYARLENTAFMVNLHYALLQSIGGSLWCLGKAYIGFLEGGMNWGLGFGCMIYGACFAVFGFLLGLAFIFYLFDAVVQLGIVGALLPFLIASWPFKITSKYTSTGFKMLLNSIFTFMMMGVVVKIGIELIDVAVEMNTKGSRGNEGGIQALANALNTIDTPVLERMVNVWSIGFILFLFANIMGFLAIAKVQEFTSSFAGGGMKPSAPAIATMGASTIKGAASKVAAPTMNAIGEKVDRGVSRLTKGTVNFVANRATFKWTRNYLSKKMGLNKSEAAQQEKNEKINNIRQTAFGDATSSKTVIVGNRPTQKPAASESTVPNPPTVKISGSSGKLHSEADKPQAPKPPVPDSGKDTTSPPVPNPKAHPQMADSKDPQLGTRLEHKDINDMD